MTTHSGTRGGTHEQHVKAGQQSHKNASSQDQHRTDRDEDHKTRGGTHDQHVKAGQQSHKNS
ncbi:hypothetical protein J8I29_25825 [Labrys sp. LIt4]|uniref:Uncharacterized protein n=1 Tax=Labrys okinawensis TaxID=346911 RepID=A0A2S9Q3U7_9HYPH|nr:MULTISPECIES: hypothetical protein [Labrys]MBP0582771.1 hypothetical protein [Labrys sp. LIt4]PRH83999.1 hypothetical protein C5L14_29505 [Labrys okinawensis]